jgi:hypothetical protein
MTTEDDERRDRYEDRLLTELRALATANAAAGAPERAPRRVRPRLALAGVAGGACAATAAFALMGGEEASTAYAVEPQGDGTVTVEIHELQDAAGLERQLREHGIAAKVDYLPAGQGCREPRFTPARRDLTQALSLLLAQRADGSVAFTVDKRQLRPGETLVITSSLTGTNDVTVVGGPGEPAAPAARAHFAAAIAVDEVAPCDPVPLPTGPVETAPDPAAPSGGTQQSAGGSGTSEGAD